MTLEKDEIAELFQNAIKETDSKKLFEDVELLIFLIKTKYGLEVPFTNESNGDIKRAYALYLERKYQECITELRRVKKKIIKNIRRG